jgi:hypothetical protein
MYCTSFAGARCGGADNSIWMWSGDTAPRTITSSRAWHTCRIRSRARSAMRPRRILYRYFVIQMTWYFEIIGRVRAVPVFRHSSILVELRWKPELKIVHFHVSQLVYLAQRLDAMPEEDSTVLDNSCLLFLSNMWSGTKHDNKKVPVVTIGVLGGKLETGRALDYFEGATTTASCVAYTWGSWIGWASNSRSSATPKSG